MPALKTIQIGLTGYVIAGKPDNRQFVWPIVIERVRDLDPRVEPYRVLYGRSIRSCHDYQHACFVLGEAVMHALNSDGAFSGS